MNETFEQYEELVTESTPVSEEFRLAASRYAEDLASLSADDLRKLAAKAEQLVIERFRKQMRDEKDLQAFRDGDGGSLIPLPSQDQIEQLLKACESHGAQLPPSGSMHFHVEPKDTKVVGCKGDEV